jgi:hypothetical protein
MEGSKTIKIEKVGMLEEKEKVGLGKEKKLPKSILKKTSKKINLKGVQDPSSTKKHSVKILTSKGMKKSLKKTSKQLKILSDDQITKTLQDEGLLKKNTKMPKTLRRKVFRHALHAGFIS